MAKQNIAPTRSNYMRIEDSLEHARRGYELLDQKREILVMELMNHMESARVAQEEVREAMEKAYEELRDTALSCGMDRLQRESCGVQANHRLRISTRSVMGVNVPEVNFNPGEQELAFGILSGASGADGVRQAFRDALEAIVELAEVENAVLRLARELKRTQRRVNALQNSFIPEYEETLDYIGDRLEEKEREEMVIMKKVKEMNQPSEQKTGPGAGGEEEDA